MKFGEVLNKILVLVTAIVYKSLRKVICYSDAGESFILICNKYQSHKDAKINIFRSILS